MRQKELSPILCMIQNKCLPRLAHIPAPTRLCRYSSHIRWTPPTRLGRGDVENYPYIPKELSNLGAPVLMPQRYFWEIPAIHKWFKESSNDSCVAVLDCSYLESFQDIIVPLEYTLLPGKMHHVMFHRAEAPFGIFLAWAKNAHLDTVDRFYLAQASVSTLPEGLTKDLPTPSLVARAGKGDLYDTNIWIGVPPTYTPLHRDPNPNLLVQLAGRKAVRLLAPDDGRRVYAEVQESIGSMGSAAFRGEEMMKGEEKALLEARVWDNNGQHGSADAVGFEAHLGCGDGLFIPQGWWHSVKGIGDGMTASVSHGG